MSSGGLSPGRAGASRAWLALAGFLCCFDDVNSSSEFEGVGLDLAPSLDDGGSLAWAHLSGGLVDELGVRVSLNWASNLGNSIGVVGSDLSLAEAWETWEGVGAEVAVAEIWVVSRATGWEDGGNNGDSSVGADPGEAVVSSICADSDLLWLGEEGLKAGGGLGDSEEES